MHSVRLMRNIAEYSCIEIFRNVKSISNERCDGGTKEEYIDVNGGEKCSNCILEHFQLFLLLLLFFFHHST